MISIYMSQIAITICVSLLASWLVAVSLIPMIVGAHEDAAGRAQREGPDPAPAAPLRPACCAGRWNTAARACSASS